MSTYSAEYSFSAPTEIYGGAGSREKLRALLGNYQRILVVTGSNAYIKTGFPSILEEMAGGKPVFFFDGIEQNPSINTVIRGGAVAAENRCDLVIGFGGGSALDAAKAVAAFATNNRTFYDLLPMTVLPNPALDVIAVPTTCGTGSEVNQHCIITDVEKKDKVNFSKPSMCPKYAILDPFFLSTLEERLVLATAFDAFSHLFEGYMSSRANMLTDALAEKGMREFFHLAAGSHRSENALAGFLHVASLGGIVIKHTGTTLLHAMGYWLTNRHGIHHGTANAMLMPAYWGMLEEYGVEKFLAVKKMAKEAGFDPRSWADKLQRGDDYKSILGKEGIVEMAKYAAAKPNAALTPFGVNADYVAKFLNSWQ